MIELVGFDADDTLWHSQNHFDAAQAEFEAILGRYLDLSDRQAHDRLAAVERANVRLFGYGAKGMTLSMIETAIELSGGRISGLDIGRIVDLGKAVLEHKVEVMPGAREAVGAVAARHGVVLITKGDLFHQERKVAESGLAGLFHRIEIVSEKDMPTYRRVLAEFNLPPERFAMVGNSLRSDIEPVLAIGGSAVHIPYASTWVLEAEHAVDLESKRLLTVDTLAEVPEAIALLAERAIGEPA
jgi:putative hydrolase of the HAD superfamily